MVPRIQFYALVLAALAGALLFVVPAFATTVVPVPEPIMARDAVAIVIGHVDRIQSHRGAATGQIFTDIAVTLEETLKGQLPVTEVIVRQRGGRVPGHGEWIEGSPEFRRGERVLLFLSRRPDGTLRVAHLFQGKFSITRDPGTGEDRVERDAHPAGVQIHGGAAGAARSERLEEMKARLRALLTSALDGRGAGLPLVTDATAPASDVTATHDAFTYLDSPPARWFEPDSGLSIAMRMNSAGEPAASNGGFPQLRSAYAVWNGVAGSRARFQDAGMTAAAGFQNDGVNAITFGDPLGEIDPPSSCTGTLAIGGYYHNGETRTVNGITFYRIIEGDIVFANGWQGCNFYETYANLVEVATHELGHVLGLGHSASPDAIMYAYAHLDGRGGALTSDDIAGVTAMYPAPVTTTATLTVTRAGTGAGTVTASPAGITCGTDCSQAYTAGTAVTLTASPASGSRFAGWSGGCTGTGGCLVTVKAATTVTATFSVATGLTASFSYPAAGATVHDTQSVGMATDKWGTSKTLTLTVDGVLLTRQTITGTTLWYSWNTRTLVNGTHTLRLTVTDATGASATATRSVIVANTTTTTTAPSFTASFSYPAEGATVRGSLSVGMATTATWGQSKTFTLLIDGRTLTTQTLTGTTLWYYLDTRPIANGTHTLTLRVTWNGGTATAARHVTIAN